MRSFISSASNFTNISRYRERFAKPSWDNNIPPEKKLTDEDVRRFVVSVQSVSMQAVFSPSTVMNFAVIFNDLATLRPDIVVPPLLDTLVKKSGM